MIVFFRADFADPVGTKLLADAIEASGLKVDLEVQAYDDGLHSLGEWSVQTVPCVAKVHAGTAVDQIADSWIVGKSAASIKGRFTNAVKAHDAANAAMLP